MPSSLVHLAFAGMIAAVLLGGAFDRRSLLVVLGVTAIPDLDAFVGLFFTFGHRTAFHTFLIPALAAALLAVDEHRPGDGLIRGRWGWRGVRIAWVSIFCFAVAAIGLDLFTGGVNPLWPLHDQFWVINGKIELSNKHGIVQTFVDLSRHTQNATQGGPHPHSFGSSQQVHISTGVDPQQGPEPADVERVFPVVRSGWQLLLLLVGSFVTAARFWIDPTREQ
ncbi:MAG: metal-dependent hydrolase [Haloarculaceae archaeon]